MNHISLKWNRGTAAGYTDQIPAALLQRQGSTDRAEHVVIDPQGDRSIAYCSARVTQGIADLDYEPFAEENLARGMNLGVMRIHFANRGHTIVRKVEWKERGSTEFTKTDLKVIGGGANGAPIIFDSREHKADFLAWRAAHPDGFVLNWPRGGVTPSMRVVFHKSSCNILATISFPTSQWHKVCDDSLASLTQWASSRKRLANGPEIHPCGDCFPHGATEFQATIINTTSQIDLAVDDDVPDRVESKVLRIVRDSGLARQVKTLHRYVCQLCPTVIELPGGDRYAEAHHLKPLGGIHRGKDKLENLMCVCPTCHAKLDYGVIPLRRLDIREVEGHMIGEEFLQYHNEHVFCGA